MTGRAPQHGTAIFWSALLAFALADGASLARAQLAAMLPWASVAAVLAYVLLGGFALALGYVAGVTIPALRARQRPAAGDLVRVLALLALVAGHVALLVRAR
ncbi:MAG TPA: hypothetical protein VF904_01805 [Anaeromyxobacteraceae bacterium]